MPAGGSSLASFGGPALNRMEANGWTKTTIKPGDVVTGTGYQFSDGQKIIRLEKIVLSDGKSEAQVPPPAKAGKGKGKKAAKKA